MGSQIVSEEGQTHLEEATNIAKRIIYRISDFEQIFNIHEGSANIKYSPNQTEDLVNTITDIISPDLGKKWIRVETEVERSFPSVVSTHLDLLKQVTANIVTSLT